MKKIDYCPCCGVRLVPDKGLKMKCPTINCDFKDRRHGSSMVDPKKDRRGNGQNEAAWMNVDMR